MADGDYYQRRMSRRRQAIAEHVIDRIKPQTGDPATISITDTDSEQTKEIPAIVMNLKGESYAVGVKPQEETTATPIMPENQGYTGRQWVRDTSYLPQQIPAMRRLTNDPNFIVQTERKTILQPTTQSTGQAVMSLGRPTDKTTLKERIDQDAKLGVSTAGTIARESKSLSNDLSERSISSDNPISSFGYNALRVFPEAANFVFENKWRTIGLIGLGMGAAGLPSAVAGATGGGAASGIVSGIMQGAGSIGTTIYVPATAKSWSESGDLPRSIGRTAGEIGLVMGGAELTKPRTSITVSDSVMATRRDIGKMAVRDISTIGSESISAENQYFKQTISLSGKEIQTARVNVYNQDQLLTSSKYGLVGEMNTEPKGVSKFIRSIFTKNPISPVPISVTGTSEGTLNLLPDNYVEGITQVNQKTTVGQQSENSKYFIEPFYKAAADSNGLMQFKGMKASSFGGYSEFSASELTRVSMITQPESMAYDRSRIVGGESGKISYSSYAPNARDTGFFYKTTRIVPVQNEYTGLSSSGSVSASLKGSFENLLAKTGIVKTFAPQSLNLKQETGLIPIAKTGQETAQTQSQTMRVSQEVNTRAKTVQRPIINIKPVVANKPVIKGNIIPKSITLPGKSIVSQRQAQRTIPTSKVIPIITPIPPMSPPTSPPTTTTIMPPAPPTILPPIPGIGDLFGARRTIRRPGRIRQKTQYQPDVTSLMLNIKGKQPKVITPFTPRPMRL